MPWRLISYALTFFSFQSRSWRGNSPVHTTALSINQVWGWWLVADAGLWQTTIPRYQELCWAASALFGTFGYICFTPACKQLHNNVSVTQIMLPLAWSQGIVALLWTQEKQMWSFLLGHSQSWGCCSSFLVILRSYCLACVTQWLSFACSLHLLRSNISTGWPTHRCPSGCHSERIKLQLENVPFTCSCSRRMRHIFHAASY